MIRINYSLQDDRKMESNTTTTKTVKRELETVSNKPGHILPIKTFHFVKLKYTLDK